MNEYEIMLMLDPELTEERGAEIIDRMRAEIEKAGGTWDGQEAWGRRKLAYEIKHKGEGVYHLLLFTSPPAALAEVSRILKITDGVMRHMAVLRVHSSGRREPVPTAAAPAEPPTVDSAA
jgi:small subunit ribosomal protein S6